LPVSRRPMPARPTKSANISAAIYVAVVALSWRALLEA
jgi:hypothetical protein